MKLTPILLSILLTLGLASTAIAGGHGDKHHGKRIAKVMKQLDLDESQKQALKQLRQDMMPQYKALKEEHRALRSTSPKTIAPEDPYFEEKVNSFAAASAALLEKRIKLAAERRAKVSEILTVAQREKLAQLMSERRGKKKGNMKKRKQKMMEKRQKRKAKRDSQA